MNGPTIDGGPPHVRLQVSRLVKVAKDGVEAGARGGTGILWILGERYGSLNAITSRRLTGKKPHQYKEERRKRNRTSIETITLDLLYYACAFT